MLPPKVPAPSYSASTMGRQAPYAPEKPLKFPDRLRETPLQYISRA
jgi:hypothetical protein